MILRNSDTHRFFVLLIFSSATIYNAAISSSNFSSTTPSSSLYIRPLIHHDTLSNLSTVLQISKLRLLRQNLIGSRMDETDFFSPFEPILKPCDLLLNGFLDAVVNYTTCIMKNSLPPRVCTRCIDYYIALDQAYFNLKDSVDVRTSDGVPCDQVIFGMYSTVYVQDLYDVLYGTIWTKSRCTDCLEYDIHSPNFHTSRPRKDYPYNNRTEKILSLHSRLYDCIQKAGGASDVEYVVEKNATVICAECWKEYDDLNLYYENSIMEKRGFCVDVDSAINDTIRLWRQEIKCDIPALPTKNTEAAYVALIAVALGTLTIIFYSGSFMQGTRKKRRLKKYRSGYPFGSISAGINNDIIQAYVNETQRQTSPVRQLGRSQSERTPLLFAGGRRVISYSQLPPSNLG